MDMQQETDARVRRDMARLLRHLVESGLDASSLNMDIRLTVRDGQLTAVEFGEAEAPNTEIKPSGRKKKSNDA